MMAMIRPMPNGDPTVFGFPCRFPAASLPRLRFDRKFACSVLIIKDFSMRDELRKIFSLSFPEWQGRGREGSGAKLDPFSATIAGRAGPCRMRARPRF